MLHTNLHVFGAGETIRSDTIYVTYAKYPRNILRAGIKRVLLRCNKARKDILAFNLNYLGLWLNAGIASWLLFHYFIVPTF